MKVVGLCVHGLMGDVYSLGMDALASKLNHATPEGVHFDVAGGNDPDLVAGNLTNQLLAAAKTGAVPMVLGHSLGGDFVWKFADAAKQAGVALPLMGSIDPVDWTSNSNEPGNWYAPDNVGIALNFRQPVYPGGGFVKARDPSRTTVYEHTYSYPHANFGQALAMDTAPDIHAAILAAVLFFIKQKATNE
jgi:hypothetical protein